MSGKKSPFQQQNLLSLSESQLIKQALKMLPPLCVTFGELWLIACEEAPSAFISDSAGLRVEARFQSAPLSGCLVASPVLLPADAARPSGQAATAEILVVSHLGEIIALNPKTGAAQWQAHIPLSDPNGESEIELLATPALVAKRFVVFAYQELSLPDRRRLRHRLLVFDLQSRQPSTDFAPLDLTATLPAADGSGAVVFDSTWQLLRSALQPLPLPGNDLGLVYVALGNGPSRQPFHGWLFELDLTAWRDAGPAAAITGRFVTTAENDCGPPGNDNTMVCGGGVWNAAGVQLRQRETGSTEIFAATGNGRVDFDRGAYAHSLLRLGRGLRFDRGCDESLCAPFDELSPNPVCLASCRDIFVARLPTGAPPLQPADGSCDGLSFLQCYGVRDADLGANAPAFVTLADGQDLVVQAGKDGALYLLDAAHLGTLYHRLQVMDFCGTPDDPCDATWIGTFVTHPAVVDVDGASLVVLTSVMSDGTHPSGITAVRVLQTQAGPRLELAWQVPDFASDAARQVFRHHPGRPLAFTWAGESYVAVMETRRGGRASAPGQVWLVRARDGHLVARLPLSEAGQRYTQPLWWDETLYLSVCDGSGFAAGRVDAFQLQPL